MQTRDVYRQVSTSQALRQDANNTANNFVTGVSSDYRSYIPGNSKYATVAITRSSAFNPQKSFSNISGTGRYSSREHSYANSSSLSATANRISYLSPSASRPSTYYWGQNHIYNNPSQAAFANQATNGLNFYRFSDGNKVVMDQFKNSDQHLLHYNHVNLDTNLLTISTVGGVSKIESTTDYQDSTSNQTTPLLFQTHGGIGANDSSIMVTDYARDSNWVAADNEVYVIYHPNFGSNKQLPDSIETMGEWWGNMTGERSGRKNKKK